MPSTTPPAEKTTYYLIHNRQLAKDDGKRWRFDPLKGWVPDEDNKIQDMLMGYDSSEPPESPYAMFSMSIMDAITPIPEAEARHRALLVGGPEASF